MVGISTSRVVDAVVDAVGCVDVKVMKDEGPPGEEHD